MGVQLRALAQPPAQHLRALLDHDVPGQQALVNGPFGLPPQRLAMTGMRSAADVTRTVSCCHASPCEA
jgi:hypothetical protein